MDLFAYIENGMKNCGLHGKAINVVYTTAAVFSNCATMQRSESTSVRSNEAATANHLQLVGIDRWLKWDVLSARIKDWLRDVWV